MAEYYNTKPYTIVFTSTDGGRLSLPAVIPGKKPKTVKGDYYLPLVERGLLAEWTDAVADKYKTVMLQQRGIHVNLPSAKPKPGFEPKPAQKPNVEHEVKEEPEEEVYESSTGDISEAMEDEEAAEEGASEGITREELEEHTVKELKAMIEMHNLGDLPQEVTKKSEIIDFILDQV